MPRVVENQLEKFKTDPLLKQLQTESEIRYTGHHTSSVEERRIRFRTDCYEGSSKIAFLRNGVNVVLSFPKAPNSQYTSSEYVDFVREPGKIEDKLLKETLRRKHGSFEAASTAKALEEMCSSSLDVGPRSSCIYECCRITQK